MQVTKIAAQQKNPQRVSVYVDGAYALSLTIDQLLEQKLRVGNELDDARLTLLLKLSEDGKVRARALEWVLLRPRSAQELLMYLRRKKTDELLTTAIMHEFSQKKYQDDGQFARWWVENRLRKNKSNHEIRRELRQKGIDREIIEGVMHDSVDQKQRLRTLVAQKIDKSAYRQDTLRLKRYLMAKGFAYSDIDDALTELGADDGSF